jgi:D-arabinose 1-dehydrogenase-like Zn-dependent alcohol dehydrogenase
VTGQREFELVDRELVAPRAGHVRLRVQSCGVCHSDVLGVEGQRADPSQPIVPGHEVVGVVDAVGDGVTAWEIELFGFEDAPKAYERMMCGDARFRVVLDMATA